MRQRVAVLLHRLAEACHAAVDAGAAYLDSTGEPPFIRRVFEHYGPRAAATGARLITAFGYDYVPGNTAGAAALEQLLLSPHPLALLVLGKVAAHWVAGVLPLVLVAPVLALQFGLPASAIGVLVASLLLGSPVLSLVGSLGAALTLGLRGGGVLMSLLVLPLLVPVLIFGAGAVQAHLAGLDVVGHFSLLGALLLLALLAAPAVTGAALRIALE